MGNSVSCICDPSSASRRQVLVMKEDGELLRFKEGTQVKDVLVTHPCHKVIRCCSERSVLPGHFPLSCNQLYILLPRGLALYDEIFERLLRLAASRDPRFSKVSTRRDDRHSPKETNTKMGSEVVTANKGIRPPDDDYSGYSKSWKPALKTIPEATPSPTLHAKA